MANYKLHKISKDNDTLLGATSTLYSDEYSQNINDLYLSDEVHLDEKGTHKKYYRLHAKESHTIEMAMRYDIKCPECKTTSLKQVGRSLDSHNLGLYICPNCMKDKTSI